MENAPRGLGWKIKGGCLLIVVLIVGGIVGAIFFRDEIVDIQERFQSPSQIVVKYLDAVERENWAEARSKFCAELQAQHPVDQFDDYFAEQVKGIGAWSAREIDEFPYPRSGGRVSIYYTLKGSVHSRRFQAYMKRENGRFRICDLQWQ